MYVGICQFYIDIIITIIIIIIIIIINVTTVILQRFSEI